MAAPENRKAGQRFSKRESSPASEPPPHPPFRLRQTYGGQGGHPLPSEGERDGVRGPLATVLRSILCISIPPFW